MKKLLVIPVLLLIVLAACGVNAYLNEKKATTGTHVAWHGEAIGIRKGDIAPPISLADLQGKTVQLSDFRGKTVLINFWAIWCPHCQKEMAAINRFYLSHRKKGFVVLSVNDTSSKRNENRVRTFVRQHQLRFPVLLDKTGNTSGLYHANGLPTSYFVDPKGRIYTENIGPLSYNAIQKVVKQTSTQR